jgi:hypothetical protein
MVGQWLLTAVDLSPFLEDNLDDRWEFTVNRTVISALTP